MDNKLTVLQNNLMAMAPKPFGILFEKITRYLYSINEDRDPHIDGSKNNKRVEMKISRATKQTGSSKTVYESVMGYSKSFCDIDSEKFTCNMQQVKPDLFDYLIYGILDTNGLSIFKISNRDILLDRNINFSDKQHKGNIGEGQFHIKQSNIKHHINSYCIDRLTWDNVTEILKKI